MWRIALLSASATGGFCAIFALFVDAVTDALPMFALVGVSFTSGFLGSLFARLVIDPTRR